MALVVIAAVVALVLWLVLRDNTSSSSPPSNATAVSAAQIRRLAASVAHPVFWIGPKHGYTYELTRTSNGSIYIRYLPPGVKLGAAKAYLTVATYPFPGAYAAIEAVVRQGGTTPIRIGRGGIAEASKSDPTSVHIAYPHVAYQVEVFDPTPGSATAVVASGKLSAFGKLAVPARSAGQARAVSAAGLRAAARALGHPVYWAGAQPGETYELRRTPSGQVYVRYLPAGTPVGAAGQYLTVATYPFPKAFEALQALANQPRTTQVAVPGGGIAIVDTRYRKSIHLAYPDSDYQVEVFDPSPAEARRLVKSGAIKSVG